MISAMVLQPRNPRLHRPGKPGMRISYMSCSSLNTGREAGPEVACHDVVGVDDHRFGLLDPAAFTNLCRKRTACVKAASGRRVDRGWHVALEDDALPPDSWI